jgi:hypothetical protein
VRESGDRRPSALLSALKLLKEKIAQKRLTDELTKPPKAPFVSFGSDPDRCISQISPPALAPGRAEISPEIDETEREAIAIELGGVPEIYASAFAQLQSHAPPEVPVERRHQFIYDAGIFLDQWGHDAERLGWAAEALFGLHPLAPMARSDRMGLVWMLKGERVVTLTATEARLSGGLTFYRKG